jgi:hypothetical protein
LWRHNNLSIVLVILFAVSLSGHALAGWMAHNAEERLHGGAAIPLATFLTSSEFGETVFENWESEFLQMAFYVILTVFLYQKGSAESKKHDGRAPASTRASPIDGVESTMAEKRRQEQGHERQAQRALVNGQAPRSGAHRAWHIWLVAMCRRILFHFVGAQPFIACHRVSLSETDCVPPSTSETLVALASHPRS